MPSNGNKSKSLDNESHAPQSSKEHILLIGNIENEVEDEDLERLLEIYGPIRQIERHKNCASVTLECTEDTAMKACNELNDNNWMENSIEVSIVNNSEKKMAKDSFHNENVTTLQPLSEVLPDPPFPAPNDNLFNNEINFHKICISGLQESIQESDISEFVAPYVDVIDIESHYDYAVVTVDGRFDAVEYACDTLNKTNWKGHCITVYVIREDTNTKELLNKRKLNSVTEFPPPKRHFNGIKMNINQEREWAIYNSGNAPNNINLNHVSEYHNNISHFSKEAGGELLMSGWLKHDEYYNPLYYHVPSKVGVVGNMPTSDEEQYFKRKYGSNQSPKLIKEHYLTLMKMREAKIEKATRLKNNYDYAFSAIDKSPNVVESKGTLNPLMNPKPFNYGYGGEVFGEEIEYLSHNLFSSNTDYDGNSSLCKDDINPLFKEFINRNRGLNRLNRKNKSLEISQASNNSSNNQVEENDARTEDGEIVIVLDQLNSKQEVNEILEKIETKKFENEESENTDNDENSDEVEVPPAENLPIGLSPETESTVLSPPKSQKLKYTSNDAVYSILLIIIEKTIELHNARLLLSISHANDTTCETFKCDLQQDSPKPTTGLPKITPHGLVLSLDSEPIWDHIEKKKQSEIEIEIENGSQHMHERFNQDPSEYDEFQRREKSIFPLVEKVYQKIYMNITEDSDQSTNVFPAQSLAKHMIRVLAFLGFDDYLLRMLTGIGGATKLLDCFERRTQQDLTKWQCQFWPSRPLGLWPTIASVIAKHFTEEKLNKPLDQRIQISEEVAVAKETSEVSTKTTNIEINENSSKASYLSATEDKNMNNENLNEDASDEEMGEEGEICDDESNIQASNDITNYPWGKNLVLIGDFLWQSFLKWEKIKMVIDQMQLEVNFHVNVKKDAETLKRLYDGERDKLLFAIPPNVETVAISIGITDIFNAQEEHKKLLKEDSSNEAKHQNVMILEHIAKPLRYMVEHLINKSKKVLLLLPPLCKQNKIVFGQWQSVISTIMDDLPFPDFRILNLFKLMEFVEPQFTCSEEMERIFFEDSSSLSLTECGTQILFNELKESLKAKSKTELKNELYLTYSLDSSGKRTIY